MSGDGKRKRRVELRVVDADTPQPPLGRGGGSAGGDGGGLGGLPGERPVVQIRNGKRAEAIDEAELHLVKRDPDLFRRDEQIVRVSPAEIDVGEGRTALALRIVAPGAQHLRERFTRAVDLQRFDKKSGEWQSCDCPRDFAEAYIERSGLWRLPRLRGVTTAPCIRPDGTLIEQKGYDRATGIFYDPRGTAFPPVPSAPTRADARAALDRLKILLATFDFVDDAARAVALSAILTCLLRRAMSAAPLHAFSAPVAGSGKSKLVNVAAILATGHRAPVTALGDSEEAEKRLGTSLIAGDAVIALDNVERPLGGEFLCQLVTQSPINVRVLGKSLNVQVPNVHCMFATGNNLKVLGDMTRRALIGRLDPHCERPELREFETPDPEQVALRERPDLVIAALTIVRAFFLAGTPNDTAPLGSFNEWSKWVRDPLIWLGERDPVATIELARADDPRLSALTAVLHGWDKVNKLLGDTTLSARELIERAETPGGSIDGGFLYADFREALMAVGADRGGKLSPQRLGNWLGKVKGRSVGGLKIEPTILDGITRWRIAQSPE